MNRLRSRWLGCALALAAGPAAQSAAGQDAPPLGFAADAAAHQSALEREAIELIRPELMDSLALLLAREPHVAGSAAQARTRDVVLEFTRARGLRSEAPEYLVWLPWADSVEVDLIAPLRRRITLGEPSLEGAVQPVPQYPWVSGYSGVGTAAGEVVYVNYGLHEDYAALERLGVRVRGRIVIARFGRSFRGIKASLAEQQGAAGLLLYSDPWDDGYYRGDTWPAGPWRSAHSAQRGSVLNGNGDPSTPHGPSVAGAQRLHPDSVPGLPRIPVVPLSWSAAQPILAAIAGAALPSQDWQGALPFRYHVGPGPARVRVHVSDDRARAPFKPIWNTIAWLPGAERPDEWIVIGAHRDAWGAGAFDNVSGTASVLGAAHALAALAAGGDRPRRTVVFATWDAEEWGLVGSTEWVEELAERLDARVVAYLNQDAIAGGPSFGAAATPSLERLIHQAAEAVPAPYAAAPGGEAESLYARWRGETGAAAALNDAPAINNLGGGSDYAAFYNHLGIPSAGWGFGGGGTQYHSAYDTREWMDRFGDPGYERHAASSRLTAVVALRLANAEILPLNYSAYATEMRELLRSVSIDAEQAGMDVAALEPVERSLREMERDAADFAMARERWLASARRTPAQADSANARLMRVERALTRPEGLRGRPWFRNLAFAADAENGYATLAFPSLVEAIRSGDSTLFWGEARDIALRIARASARLREARAALGADGRRGG
ncbi:MAG TPA: M20/M25/M40 family metallo-hydrolase [Longimicrobiales bacterium]|nr:M20/M25/M40 family metallo-hydrolase [Longimicrobiales bacterium]